MPRLYLYLIASLVAWAIAFAIVYGFSYATAQTVTVPGSTAAVCAYNTSPPTATTGNFVLVQCTSTGSLLLH